MVVHTGHHWRDGETRLAALKMKVYSYLRFESDI